MELTSVAVRHFIAATAFIALIAYAVLYGRVDGKAPIQSDGYSYYVYLPSWFIYKDISLEALANDWYGGTYPSFTGLRRWPSTGRWMNLHPIGTAILEAPFFAAADALSWWSNLPRDGFSLYYEHAAGLAGLAYFVGGLAFLRRLLMHHFTNGVVLATLVCITWGTNLFHYGVFDATFSHAFAFFGRQQFRQTRLVFKQSAGFCGSLSGGGEYLSRKRGSFLGGHEFLPGQGEYSQRGSGTSYAVTG